MQTNSSNGIYDIRVTTFNQNQFVMSPVIGVILAGHD